MKRTKMITKALENEFKKTGRQEEVADPVVIAKYFNPYGRSTWFATEYDPVTRECFGFVQGEWDSDCDEWSYFSITELESVMVPALGSRLPLERDLYFSSTPMSEACPAALVKLGR